MLKQFTLAILVAFILTGCALSQKVFTGEPWKGDEKVEQELALVEFAGEMTCLVTSTEGSDADRMNLLKAHAQAEQVLASDAPTFAAIQVAFTQFPLKQRAALYINYGFRKIAVLYGDKLEPVKQGTLQYEALRRFVNGCGTIVGDITPVPES